MSERTRQLFAWGDYGYISPGMFTTQPPCPHCRDGLFVREDLAISGRRVTQLFFCGRCEYEWHVADPAQERERRHAQRRARTLEDASVRTSRERARRADE